MTDEHDAYFELAIVGAGVVGCALAWRLARELGRERVVLLEQAEREGTGVSSRNSGVVHAGLYYEIASLKAITCVEGNERTWAWVAKRGVSHRRTGKLVVARDEAELAALIPLYVNGRACGAELEIVSPQRARELEPLLEGPLVAAIWSPRSGIVDALGFVRSLRVAAEQAGASVLFGARVTQIEDTPTGFSLTTTRGRLHAERMINAAGLHADELAAMLGLQRPIVPARGDYFRLRRARPYQRLLYPVQAPGSPSLGVHLTLALDGSCRLGPDLDWDCSKHDFGPAQGERKHERFHNAAERLLGPLDADALVYDGCGIRPKLVGPIEPAADFELIRHPVGVLHMLGIESPGLTAALALAEHVALTGG